MVAGPTTISRALSGMIIVTMFLVIGCGTSTHGRAVATQTPFVTPAAEPLCPSAQSATNLQVNVGSTGTPTNMVLTSDLTSPVDLVPTNTALAQKTSMLLDQWNPPMLRLHLGFRYGTATLPEETYGLWDFSNLDAFIGQLRATNHTFYFEIGNGPPWMYDSSGQLRDQSFTEFANYAARIVSWYNKGGFTDEMGRYHASGHINWVHTWEIWNEPNSGFEIPAPIVDKAATWMPADRFAVLYDVASRAMRAVDPSILTGGPSLSSWPDIPYLQTFIQDVQEPLDFLSFHFYAIGDPTNPDTAVLSSPFGPRFLDRLVAARQALDLFKPGQHIPIWIDEVGENESTSAGMDHRGTSAFSYAFFSEVFILALQQQISLLAQYSFVGSQQLGIIDAGTLQTLNSYWYIVQFSRLFPPGVIVLPLLAPNGTGLVALAALTPDRQSLRIVVANTLVAHPTDNAGAGVPATATINIAGLQQKLAPEGDRLAQEWHFDATTPVDVDAPSCQARVQSVAQSASITVTIGGYGATLLDIPLQPSSGMSH